MNKQQALQKSIDYIDWILAGNEPYRTVLGLCDNLRSHISRWAYHAHSIGYFIEKSSEKWPKYSGNYEYPVPHPVIVSPVDAYYETEDLWDRRTQYGRNRYEFCEFIRDEMVKELEGIKQ